MMKSLSTAIAVTLGLTTLCHPTFSFTIAPLSTPPKTDIQRGLAQLELSRNNDNEESTTTTSTSDSRRVFFRDTCASLVGGAFAIMLLPEEAAAIPGVTVAEFEILVRDSGRHKCVSSHTLLHACIVGIMFV